MDPVGHRVAGVHHEIEQQLFHLRWVHAHGAHAAGNGEVERDVFAYHAVEHALHASHHVFDLNHLGGDDLAAREGEQLSREGCGAVCHVDDFGDVGSGGVALWKRVEGQLGVAADDGEQVVEVVGDTSREAPQRVHLLGLQQLGGELALFGDVFDHGSTVGGHTVFVAHEAEQCFHPALLSGGGGDSVCVYAMLRFAAVRCRAA